MHELRLTRRRVALLTGIADIAGHWPLDKVTQALSDFADGALSATISHLLLQAADAGEIVLADSAPSAKSLRACVTLSSGQWPSAMPVRSATRGVKANFGASAGLGHGLWQAHPRGREVSREGPVQTLQDPARTPGQCNTHCDRNGLWRNTKRRFGEDG